MQKQDDNFFKEHIYPIYKKSSYRVLADSTLRYLNLLAPSKVEKNLIIPFLKETFNNSKNVGFWEFMSKIYPEINTTIGTSDSGATLTNSNFPIARLVFENINVNPTVDVEFLLNEISEMPEEFIVKSYHYVLTSYSNGEPDYEIMGLTQINQDEEYYEVKDVAGYDYTIPVNLLLEEKNKIYLEIKEAIENDPECEFREKYLSFMEYYYKKINESIN